MATNRRGVFDSPCGTYAWSTSRDGQVIRVDHLDRHFLERATWSCVRGGYVRANLSGYGYVLLHRVVAPDVSLAVFLNGDKCDCRRSNIAQRQPRPVVVNEGSDTASQVAPCGRAFSVSLCDARLLFDHQWSIDGRGYVLTWDGARFVKLHRLIANASPGQIVDHRDGDRLNCTRGNLRLATKSENAANIRAVRSLSGFKGVHHAQPGGLRPYSASITVDGISKHLGYFSTAEEAAEAYDAAAIVNFGEFAATNKVLGLL